MSLDGDGELLAAARVRTSHMNTNRIINSEWSSAVLAETAVATLDPNQPTNRSSNSIRICMRAAGRTGPATQRREVFGARGADGGMRDVSGIGKMRLVRVPGD